MHVCLWGNVNKVSFLKKKWDLVFVFYILQFYTFFQYTLMHLFKQIQIFFDNKN